MAQGKNSNHNGNYEIQWQSDHIAIQVKIRVFDQAMPKNDLYWLKIEFGVRVNA